MLKSKNSSVKDTARHERGAYFTPEPVARFMAQWALGEQGRRVLEPSCGEAQFLTTAHQVTNDGRGDVELWGVELHEASVLAARALLDAQGAQAKIRHANFLMSLAPQIWMPSLATHPTCVTNCTAVPSDSFHVKPPEGAEWSLMS